MPQKTLTGEDVEENIEEDIDEDEEDSFWAEGSFSETMSRKDWELKKRTFHLKHNEEMNYNCKQCHTKISAHNKDWHAHLCDKCFDKMVGHD